MPLSRSQVITPRNRTRLRTLLREYLAEALGILADGGEWPRPRSAPLVLRELVLLEHDVDVSASGRRLNEFLHDSHLGEWLDTTRHAWVWGMEVFDTLFIEHYARRYWRWRLRDHDHTEVDAQVFDGLFKSAWAELSRSTVTLRQVIAITGPPLPRGTVRIRPDVKVVPFDINSARPKLFNLLNLRHQRDSLTVTPAGSGVLAYFDLAFGRVHTEETYQELHAALQKKYLDVMLAFRLCVRQPCQVDTTHIAQLSTFPLYPLTSQPGQDHWGGRYVSVGRWTPELSRELSSAFNAIRRSSGRWQNVEPSARRYLFSFEYSEQRRNLVDLVVSLEGLFGVGPGEVSFRLASRVASLMGRSAHERVRIFEGVKAAYRIRNALVHGANAGDREEEIRKVLRKLWPGSAEQEADRQIRRLVEEVREYVRLVLKGRVLSRARWPSTEARWARLLLDSKAAASFRRSARISRALSYTLRPRY